MRVICILSNLVEIFRMWESGMAVGELGFRIIGYAREWRNNDEQVLHFGIWNNTDSRRFSFYLKAMVIKKNRGPRACFSHSYFLAHSNRIIHQKKHPKPRSTSSTLETLWIELSHFGLWNLAYEILVPFLSPFTWIKIHCVPTSKENRRRDQVWNDREH